MGSVSAARTAVSTVVGSGARASRGITGIYVGGKAVCSRSVSPEDDEVRSRPTGSPWRSWPPGRRPALPMPSRRTEARTRRDTGSMRESRPCAISDIAATDTMGLVIEAIQKAVSCDTSSDPGLARAEICLGRTMPPPRITASDPACSRPASRSCASQSSTGRESKAPRARSLHHRGQECDDLRQREEKQQDSGQERRHAAAVSLSRSAREIAPAPGHARQHIKTPAESGRISPISTSITSTMPNHSGSQPAASMNGRMIGSVISTMPIGSTVEHAEHQIKQQHDGQKQPDIRDSDIWPIRP